MAGFSRAFRLHRRRQEEMNILALLAMAAVLTASAQTGQTNQNSIAIPNRTLMDAEGKASSGSVGKEGAIAVGVSEATPDNDYPTLAVRVIDYASVPPEMLRRALSIAEAIFRKAGVKTAWVLCPGRDEANVCRSLDKASLGVTILPPAMEDPRLSDQVLGSANRAISIAYIFYRNVQVSDLAGTSHQSQLLASVMVHEVGHLLGLEHSQSGIMREHFRRIDIDRVAPGYLTFSENQALQAQRSISSRIKKTELVALVRR
jgi:hypothetical protein